MYPNPVVNDLTIEVELYKSVDDLSIDIYDAAGQLVRKSIVMDIDLTPGTKKYKLNVADMAKGVYSVRINVGKHKINKKLIVISN